MDKFIIFDMDGTLFQTKKILAYSLEETFSVFKEEGKWKGDAPLEKYEDIMGAPLPIVWDTLLPDFADAEKIRANSLFHMYLQESISTGKGDLYPNALKVFKYLKDNDYLIFIASNGLTSYLNEIVKYYKLEQYITEVFSIEQIVSNDKRNLVHSIKEKYNIHQCIVVGDRISDIHAAKANNFISVGCRFDFSKEEELLQSDYIIDDLSDLISLSVQYI